MRDRRPRGRPETPDKHAINDKITAPKVRVIAVDGGQLGILDTSEAIKLAEEQGVDLVEVAPNSDPPVCRMLDYGKLKYRESKKAAEARKHSASNTIKELRIRYRTDSHDLDTKIRKAKKFLENGDRVKFQMRFRGREVAYRDLGEETFDQLIELLEGFATVEQRTRLVGNSMSITFAPVATVAS